MPRYNVYFVAVASYVVEGVEAEDGDEASELAYDKAHFPYFPAGMPGDLGDWTMASELFPDTSKPEDDYREI